MEAVDDRRAPQLRPDAATLRLLHALTDASDGLVTAIAEEIRPLRRDGDRRELTPAELDEVRRFVEAAFRTLGEGRAAGPVELEAAARLGAGRARQGTPLDVVQRAFRIAGREVLLRLQDLAAELGVDGDTTIGLVADLWDWIDQVSVAIARAHRDVELAHARRDQEQRARLLRGLTRGTIDPHRIEEATAPFELGPTADHLVLCARPTAEHPADALEHLLRPSPWSPGLVAVIDDDVVALLVAPPAEPLPVAAGIGPALPLTAAPRSYRSASRALEVSLAFGLSGTRRLDELVVHAAVLADQALSEIVLARYVDPVRALGPFGDELLHSLRTYVAHAQNVDAAARALYVHPNTLRHRLARFSQTTGADLRDFTQIAELQWALLADEAAGGDA